MVSEIWEEDDVSWRELRNSSAKQAQFLDFLTLQGDYAPEGKDYRGTTTPMCLIGGAGEGGKSYNLRTCAFEMLFRYRELGFPNRNVGLMCDTMPNLRKIHIKKLREEFGDAVEIKQSQEFGLNARLLGAEYEDLGRVLLLHGAQAHKASAQKGGELDSLLVDELTQFTREQQGEFLYQLRNSAGLPFCSFGASSNPDGPGHDHVKQLFVPEFQNLADYYSLDPEADAEQIEKIRRSILYIPMLRQENPTYEANKEAMDRVIRDIENPDIRRARDIGDWNMYLGSRFGYFSKSVNTFTWAQFLEAQGEPVSSNPGQNMEEAYRLIVNWEDYGWDLFGSFDYGTDMKGASSFHWHLVDNSGRLWTFGELYLRGMTLKPQARILKPVIDRMRPRLIYADPALKAKIDESTNGLSRLMMFALEGVRLTPCENPRIPGWASVDYVLDHVIDRATGILTSPPIGRIHATECPQLLKQLPNAPRKKGKPEDIDLDEDHALDDYRYGVHNKFHNRPKREKQPEVGSTLWVQQQHEEAKRLSEAGRWND